MLKHTIRNTEEAEVIALKGLTFLASDADRLSRFLDVTGLSLEAIRRQAAEPAFLGAVLDHVLSDQTLLFLFAETDDIPPRRIESARALLPGASHDF